MDQIILNFNVNILKNVKIGINVFLKITLSTHEYTYRHTETKYKYCTYNLLYITYKYLNNASDNKKYAFLCSLFSVKNEILSFKRRLLEKYLIKFARRAHFFLSLQSVTNAQET